METFRPSPHVEPLQTDKFGKIFRFDLRVEFEDLDQGGIVFHPNYLRYIERGRSDALYQSGASYREMIRDGYNLVLTKSSQSYHSASSLYDHLIVYTRVSELRSRIINMQQVIVRSPKEPTDFDQHFAKHKDQVFFCEVHMICTREMGSKVCRIPERFYESFKKML